MIYRARIQRDSATWREWHRQRLATAELLGVTFHRVICLVTDAPATFDYETSGLTAVQVITIEMHEDVQIEMHGVEAKLG